MSSPTFRDIVRLGIIPAACAASARVTSDTMFIGVQIIGYFELKKTLFTSVLN